MKDIATRFWQKVDRSGEHWLWTAAKDRLGYGRFRLPHGHIGAHRQSYILTYGDVPAGIEICHTCDIPACVRPDHLFIGTHAENMADQLRKGRNSPPPLIKGDHHWTRKHPERVASGEKHPQCRYTDSQIAEIVAAYHAGAGPKALREHYGVSKSQLHRFLRGER